MNTINISGKINKLIETTDKHNKYLIDVERLSGNIDTLPVIVSKDLCDSTLNVGDTISLTGQLRSSNAEIDGKKRLLLYVYTLQLKDIALEKSNEILLQGFICKPSSYRITPNGRHIADMLVAVNGKNTSNYIPCIAWGGNAKFVKDLNVGDKVFIKGRLQSRIYKKGDETRTAYEVSIEMLELRH